MDLGRPTPYSGTQASAFTLFYAPRFARKDVGRTFQGPQQGVRDGSARFNSYAHRQKRGTISHSGSGLSAKATSDHTHLRYSGVRGPVNRPFLTVILDAEGAPSSRFSASECPFLTSFTGTWLLNMTPACAGEAPGHFRHPARRSHAGGLFCSQRCTALSTCACAGEARTGRKVGVIRPKPGKVRKVRDGEDGHTQYYGMGGARTRTVLRDGEDPGTQVVRHGGPGGPR